MICNVCGAAYVVQAMSWREAERKPCPACKQNDQNTPMLEQVVSNRHPKAEPTMSRRVER
jgi:hypothetical protein